MKQLNKGLVCKILSKQFIKYFLVGGSGVLLDLGTLIFLKELLNISGAATVAMNQLILVAYNFSLNKLWTFKNKDFPHWQILKYLLLYLLNYLISIVIMAYFSDNLGIDYRLVRIGNIALSTAWNFFVYKFLIFK